MIFELNENEPRVKITLKKRESGVAVLANGIPIVGLRHDGYIETVWHSPKTIEALTEMGWHVKGSVVESFLMGYES